MNRVSHIFLLTLLVSIGVFILAPLSAAPAFADGTFCGDGRAVQQINQKASENLWIGNAVQGPWETPGNDGCFVHYQNASIYVSRYSSPSLIYGLIRDKWAKLGWEKSYLGYPTTDESDSGDGRYNMFQHGIIMWKKGTGEAFSVINGIEDAYAQQGYQQSALGYPISDEENWWDSNDMIGGQARVSWFEHGAIFWLPDPDYEGHSTITTLTGSIYSCWLQQYRLLKEERIQYPLLLQGNGRLITLSFAGDEPSTVEMTQDSNGNIQTCTTRVSDNL